jgi:hypothetical protein
MGSIGNPGISNLAQILSSSGSSLASSAITSPTVKADRQNAPTGDLVQLQQAEVLFGGGSVSSEAGLFSSFSTAGLSTPPISSLSDLVTPSTSLDSLVSSLGSSSANLLSASSNASSSTSGPSQTGSNSSSTSPADQLALYQADLLAQQTQALFGSGSPAGSTAKTLNLLA